jgi:PBSX family phage terminase large subunit
VKVAPLVGKQRESVRLSTARGNIWEGAVRSSKTVCSTLKWLRFVREAPDGPLAMVGKTERTLKRNIIDPIQAMVGKKRCVYRAGAGEVDLFGRLIYTAGANNELAVDKIKGLTLAGAYADEITTWPESMFSMLMTRLSVDRAQWFGTTNPDSKNHWFKKNYLDRAKLHLTRDGKIVERHDADTLDLHRFSFQLTDNPNLSPAYVENVKRENAGLFYRRNILGEWCLAEGAIFDMFDPEPGRHVVDIVPQIVRWIALGVDYGTVNPFHAGLLGLGVDNRLYVPGDWRYDSRKQRRQLTDAEYSARLRGWLGDFPAPHTPLRGVRPEWVAVDPSAASFRVQLYRDGLPSTAADNSVIDGIRLVSSLFAADQLAIHSSCTDLIDELSGYAWDSDAADKGLDEPLKVDDHGPDQLRYAVKTTEAIWRPHVRLEIAA